MEYNINNEIFIERAILNKSPNPKFDTTTVRYLFVIYGKGISNKKLRQRHKLLYWQ